MENKQGPKILHVINEIGMGGAEILLVESLPLIANRQIKADLVVLIDRDSNSLIKEMREDNKFKVTTLKKGSFYNPILIFKIMPYLRKYDIVHVHLFPSLYWVAIAKFLSFSSVKLVFTEHNSSNKRMDSKISTFVDKIIYRAYHTIVTISDDVDKAIKKQLKFKDSKFKLIKNGINLKNIDHAAAYPATDFFEDGDSNTKIVIQVSRFRKQKDQITLIKAITLLPENIKLLLVGQGELQSQCEQLVADLNVGHRVKFLGPRKDIPNLLKTADVIVLSSHFEGLSLASVEGLASGRPFVASDVPGLTEVVKGAGILFPLGDSDKLATIITQLLQDKEYYNEIVAKCMERSKMYDIEQMVNKEIELYKSIV